MSYVDALYDRKKDKILVVERVNGERLFNEFDAEHVFYHAHPQGQYKSIFGDACKKFSSNSSQTFRKELMKLTNSAKPPTIFESDINPVFRSLADHYSGIDAPVLNVGFFDIEVDFDPERGFAPVTDPFNPVTAVSVHTSNTGEMITLVLLPKT